MNIFEICPYIGAQEETIILNEDELCYNNSNIYEGSCALWTLAYTLITVLSKELIENRLKEVSGKNIEINDFKLKTMNENDIYYEVYNNKIYDAMCTILNNFYSWTYTKLWNNYFNIVSISTMNQKHFIHFLFFKA